MIGSGYVELKHFPMKQMFADPFPNPIQCHKFQEFCTIIMNMPEVMDEDDLYWDVQATNTYMVASNAIPQ